MVQKFYAIRSEKAIHKGAVISTLFAVVVAGGCIFPGRLLDASMETRVDVAADGYDVIIPAMLENLSPLLIGIVVILVLSASMSTLSSLVMASSSTLTLDLLKDNVIKDMDEKKQVRTMRGLIVVFIAISVVIAIVQHTSNITFIAQLMGVSWGALAGAFLAPFLYGLYWKRTTRAAVWTSFIFGAGVMTLNLLCPSVFPALLQSPINCGGLRHGGRPCAGAAGKPRYPEAGAGIDRWRLRLLRGQGDRAGKALAGGLTVTPPRDMMNAPYICAQGRGEDA